MSKKKLVALAGLAAALSFLPSGCSRDNTTEENKAHQEQRVSARRHGNREDISVSHIAAKKDYVKSVNVLLSSAPSIIPQVEKNYQAVGIEQAMMNAFINNRTKGLLKENSAAYIFADVVCKNYSVEGRSEEDFKKWSEKFLAAGREAEALLQEPESAHRKFVPTSFGKAFLRRSIVDDPTTQETHWMTCDECERLYWERQNQRNYAR